MLTVTLNDGQPSNNITSRTFSVTILPENQVPFISSIADQATGPNVPIGPISFTVGDAGTAASNLVVTGRSSNPGLIPNSNITFGGGGSNRTVSIAPALNQVGAAAITLTVTNGAGGSASTTFQLTVNIPNLSP